MRRLAGVIAAVAALAATTFVVVAVPLPARAADEPTSVAVWRPSNGTWYIRGVGAVQFGRRGDIPVPADYTGDHRSDIAVWRPSNGTWYVRGADPVHYGRAADVPVPADYTGEGRADIAVWRPSNGTWYIRGVGAVQFGRRGDIPVPADYTGDHRSDIAVWRPSNGTWYVRGLGPVKYGRSGDVQVPADYLPYDRADLAVWEPATGSWRISGTDPVNFGRSGDQPVPGDYTGDQRTDIAVWRPGDGSWRIRGLAPVFYGRLGDVPVPGAWVRQARPDRLATRTLTANASDVNGITMTAGIITLTAPLSNQPYSNLRTVLWPAEQQPTSDGQVCATWLDESSQFIQEGVALRIVAGPTGTRALTVTKNVIYGAYWTFNVHTWDSSAAQPFTQIGQYEMGSVVIIPNVGYAPFPWRICAKVAGALLTFKVWLPDREPEPLWTDATHAATTTVPSDYLNSGTYGWYVGHVPAGATAQYGELSVVQQ